MRRNSIEYGLHNDEAVAVGHSDAHFAIDTSLQRQHPCVLPASAQVEITPIFQPAPRPMPATVLTDGDLQLELYFASLTQGGAGLLRLQGESALGAFAEFRARIYPFFYDEDDAWYVLIGTDMDARPGESALTVEALRKNGSVTFTQDISIEASRLHLAGVSYSGESADAGYT